MAGRAAGCKCFSRDEPGDDNRIGDEQPAARAQNAVPLPKYLSPITEMTKHVHAHEGVKFSLAKRERFAHVGLPKCDLLFHSRRASLHFSRTDAGLADVDSRHSASGLASQEQC